MSLLDNLSVSRKLWGLVLLIIASLTIVSVASQWQSATFTAKALRDIERQDEKIADATRWRGMTETNAQRIVVKTLSTDPLIVSTLGEQLQEGIKQIGVLQQHILDGAATAADKEALTSVAERRAVVLRMTNRAGAVKRSGGFAETQRFVDEELAPSIAAYLDAIDRFVAVQRDQRAATEGAAGQARRSITCVALAALGTVLLAAIGATWLLIRSINSPLRGAVLMSEAIARGDLSLGIDATRRDELGQLLRTMNLMSVQLRALVGEVRGGVESVSTAALQIATGNLELSQRTEQQAASLQGTAASMEQITTAGAHNLDNARAASTCAVQASAVAVRGQQIVDRVVVTMGDITANSRKIADIVNVIDGIAFQTNLLALNAAVEAARAGDKGRGFAVVANEVRALSQRSAQAAKDIKALIQSSVDTITAGSGLVDQAGTTMTDIVEQVRLVTGLVDEISSASAEQAGGIRQIGAAVSCLDQVAQQNSALVEETAAAADSMKGQAQRLAKAVAVFNVSAPCVVHRSESVRPAPAR